MSYLVEDNLMMEEKIQLSLLNNIIETGLLIHHNHN
jgi:hypothetical protein